MIGRAGAADRGDRQSGLSLVEVILALGILAAVLISVSGLFILGGRHVRSGRNSSEALSVARAILEEMESWGFRQTWERYGLDGAAAAYTVDTRSNAYASRWQDRLDPMLRNGHALIEIRALGAGPPPVSRSRAIRVLVTVHWDEGERHRTVRLGTVRL